MEEYAYIEILIEDKSGGILVELDHYTYYGKVCDGQEKYYVQNP